MSKKTKPQRPWTPAERRYLVIHFPDMPNQVLAERLGRPVTSIASMGHHWGLRKTAEARSAPAQIAQGKRRAKEHQRFAPCLM